MIAAFLLDNEVYLNEVPFIFGTDLSSEPSDAAYCLFMNKIYNLKNCKDPIY